MNTDRISLRINKTGSLNLNSKTLLLDQAALISATSHALTRAFNESPPARVFWPRQTQPSHSRMVRARVDTDVSFTESPPSVPEPSSRRLPHAGYPRHLIKGGRAQNGIGSVTSSSWWPLVELATGIIFTGCVLCVGTICSTCARLRFWQTRDKLLVSDPTGLCFFSS